MKVIQTNIKELIMTLGFLPEDGRDNVYYKQYSFHHNYIIRINFNTEKIEYRSEDIPEENGITWGDTTTSNFENSENFVVLECVNRLLEKGYPPKAIALEKKYPLGRTLKGKLDIIVTDIDSKSYLMIECKTWGTEFTKEYKKMIKDGGQIFSYYANDRTVKYLCLYTSQQYNNIIDYKSNIVPVDDEWVELANVKEIHDHWNKNFKDNGIFEDWATAYGIEIKALIRGRLQPLTKDDSGRIFNQFAEILRHNVVSDKPNAFNKILNLFICKIIDEDKNEDEQVDFQWLEDDTNESLQVRLNDLYKKGMYRFLEIEVTDYSDEEITGELANISDKNTLEVIKNMLTKLRLQKNPEFAFIEVYDDQSFKTNARIVREVVELLQPYQFRYGHKQQFLGDFFELLLNTSIKQEAGQFFTPVPICRYIVSSLPIKEFVTSKLKSGDPNILPAVIDFACGTGHFLTEYMDRVQSVIEDIDITTAKPSIQKKLSAWRNYDKYDWAKEYVYGIDADYRLVKSSKVSSFLNGDGEANIIRANGLGHFILSKEYKGRLKEVAKDNPQDNGQFDVLIANPPYSVSSFKSTVKYGEKSFELFDHLTDNSSEIECLFVERMKQLLKVGGYAGIILPSSILSNSGIHTAAREIILKYFKLKGITELGTNTFMATGTSTIILFLERRPNNDYKQILSAINDFFERPKDMTVLGIEKAFSKYVTETFNDLSYDDYVTFVSKKTNDIFVAQEIWSDYQTWFNGLPEVARLRAQKQFKEKSSAEQQEEQQKLFYDKVLAIEKEKILYFLLTYSQETTIIKVGEKQAEKDFLGYEFSNRRGHEGIKMLSEGTKLYDETDLLSPRKANSYNYYAFLNKKIDIDETLERNVSIIQTKTLLNFNVVQFDKVINMNSSYRQLPTKYPADKIGNIIALEYGASLPEQQRGTGNVPVMGSNGKIGTHNKALVKGPAIIVGRKGSAGEVRWEEHDCFPIDTTFYVKILKKNILPKFVYYFLQYLDLPAFVKSRRGTGVPGLNRNDVYAMKMPIPAINVQQKLIYEIEAIEKIELGNQKKIDSLKSSLIAPNYFGYATERIEKIATMVQRGKSTKYGSSNIQIIKSGQARGYLEFDFSNKYFVSENFVSDERNLQKGDILINSTGVGTAGRVTLFELDGDYVADSHITVIRLDRHIALPRYIMYALANIGFRNIEKMANGQSGQIELALQTINGLRIPLPSIEQQNAIIAEIEPAEQEISQLEAELLGLVDKKKAILMEYFQ